MVGVYRRTTTLMLSSTFLYPTLVGASFLLSAETQGFAIDATSYDTITPAAYIGGPVGGTVTVKDNGTPSNNLTNVALDNSNLTQAGTSPKMVIWNDGYVRWTAHNFLLQSQTLQTSWTTHQCTVTADQTTAPDGTLTADLVKEDSTASAQHFINQNVTTDVIGFAYTISAYVKQAAGSRLVVLGADSSNTATWFNLGGGGSVGTKQASVISATITSVGSGWFRLTNTYICSTTPENISCYLASADNVATYNGDGASGVYFWGIQLNRGYTATPYLVTTSSARYGIPQEYDVANGRFGLLIEPAATNNRTSSEAFNDTGNWTVQASTITADTTTSPDGGVTADTLTGDATTANGHIVYSGSALAAATTGAFSVFAKAGTNNYMAIGVQGTTNDFICAVFDLLNGVVGETKVGTTGTILSTSITAVGGGWYRCSIVGNISGANPAFVLGLAQAASGNTFLTGYPQIIFAAASKTIVLWGAQQEVGSAATSYIPTKTVTVTRAVDKVGALLSTIPSFSSLSTYHQVMVRSLGTTNTVWVDFDDGTTNNFGAMINNGSTAAAVGFSAYSGGVAQALLAGLSTTPIETIFKSGFRCTANDFNDALNGATDTHDTSGSMPSSPTVFCLGGWSLGTANCGVNRIYTSVALPRALSDSELVSKTT